jgi:CheY-like chemotaxis protein
VSKSLGNLLIVEDDQEWCEAYRRVATREQIPTVKIAKNLAEAESFLNDLQFAVAFIDVGLDVSDDRNVDGLRVMRKLRDAGDETSIVVVTGRSGRDVIKIVRDAIREYDVLDIIQKAEIEPKSIARLIQSGIAAFEKRAAESRPAVDEWLRGEVPSWQWDDQMLRLTGASDGIRGLRRFLDNLLAEFMPAAGLVDGKPVETDPVSKLAWGSFWSRSAGAAVTFCYGSEAAAATAIDEAKADGMLLDRNRVKDLLKFSSDAGLKGAVFALANSPRETFALV